MAIRTKELWIKKHGGGLGLYFDKLSADSVGIKDGDAFYYSYDDSAPTRGILSKETEAKAIQLLMGGSEMANCGLSAVENAIEAIKAALDGCEDLELREKLEFELGILSEVRNWFSVAFYGIHKMPARYPEIRMPAAGRAGGRGTTRQKKNGEAEIWKRKNADGEIWSIVPLTGPDETPAESAEQLVMRA